MKRILLLCTIISICVLSTAQTTLPNMDFEDWQQSSTFIPYWICLPTSTWASGNPAATITGTYPTYRTEDSQSGSFAACLETLDIYGNTASGNLFTGWFESAFINSQAHFGVPFTGKPTAFRGWYKYTPANQSGGTIDTCSIYAVLSRWNGSERVEIARAELYTYTTVSSYTYFDLPFNYYNSLIPDTIAVIFSSSKHGDIFQGGIGSKLYVDNIDLYYDLSSVQPNHAGVNEVHILFDSYGKNISVERNYVKPASIELFDMTGKKLYSYSIEGLKREMNFDGLRTGIYVCRYSDNAGLVKTVKIYFK
ncbi:MAG: PCMD domain-containing protein [Bacteroidales bacterium]|nr:PCMD domain-containing protein [Bacteroidales bacterium]